MNELVFQNATSIPSKQVTIPVERIFGQNKAGFGRSEYRLNSMDPKQILTLLSEKFSNLSLSRSERSQSFYSNGSESTEGSVAQFQIKKKHVQTRMHIPSHKNHYAQLQLEIEKERKNQIAKSIYVGGVGQQDNQQQQQKPTILHQDKTRLQKLKQDRIQRKLIKEDNKPVIEKINEANQEFLKHLYDLNEDLITPQQQKFKNSIKYKLTYKGAFKSTAREDMQDITIKNKFAPGPGDYDVKSMFEAGKKKNKNRSISQQYQYQQPLSAIAEEDNKIMSEMNRIKSKLNKALDLEQETENEMIRIELSNINYSSVPQSNNTSYMFVKDDRDRFGDQIFPLSSLIPVPGPGRYEQNHFSMEKKISAIQSQEEQKRLLKIWLHPSKEDNRAIKEQQMRNQSLDPAGPILLKHY